MTMDGRGSNSLNPGLRGLRCSGGTCYNVQRAEARTIYQKRNSKMNTMQFAPARRFSNKAEANAFLKAPKRGTWDFARL
jgi:hypothetical protein